MNTDARRLKNFSMDAGRLQKYPPGRQTYSPQNSVLKGFPPPLFEPQIEKHYADKKKHVFLVSFRNTSFVGITFR